jgi:GT2 family glycosyltransferase
MPSVDIIIVTWNSGSLLRECVNSIDDAVRDGFELSRVVIVDNASIDGSLDGLASIPLPIKIITNPENRGFAAACNQGALESDADYLLFLNPDTRLFQNSLAAPLAFMQSPENARVGIVGIQLLDAQNHVARSCARFPTLGMFIVQALGLSRLPWLRRMNVHMSEWAHDKTRRVNHVIGAFYLVRRSLFDSLGGFDERFFVYLEDLDLSLRAHQAGWARVYFADAQAFHLGGGTSAKIIARRLFYSLRSRLLYGFKHFKLWQAWMLFAITLLLEPVSRTIFCLSRGELLGVWQTWNAYKMLYASIPEIRRLSFQRAH